MSGEGVVRYTAGELRAQMPAISAWLDGLRAAFGTATINAAIKDGIAGRPVFYATENGIEVGTPLPIPYGTCGVDSFLRLLELERAQ